MTGLLLPHDLKMKQWSLRQARPTKMLLPLDSGLQRSTALLERRCRSGAGPRRPIWVIAKIVADDTQKTPACLEKIIEVLTKNVTLKGFIAQSC